MGTPTLTVLSICTVLYLLQLAKVSGLECWQCDTFNENDGCTEAKMNKTGHHCGSYDDVCIKIVTKFEVPHTGPRNRTAEAERNKCEEKPTNRPIKEYVSKLCGEKRSFETFAKLDKACDTQTLGGGGTQTRCMCSGNLCNKATDRLQTAKESFVLVVLTISLTQLYM